MSDKDRREHAADGAAETIEAHGDVPPVDAGDGAYVIVSEGSATWVTALPDGAELVVGRGDDVAIRLSDAQVSRRHVSLVRRGGQLFARDLGSRNATVLNGAPLRGAERALAAGDVLALGAARLVVAVASGERSRVEPTSSDVELPAGVIVADPVMLSLLRQVRRVADAPNTVLILGETGSGKEVVAEQIHRASARRSKPFVRLNCAAIPEALLESELFGHERGAFSGAVARKVGYFEAADGGTLFFDEIGEMPLLVQAKVLRALETRTATPVGSTRARAFDVRLVCATHRDLESEVAAGRFRQDLYYRVNGVVLRVPPLRERPGEIAMLAESFARRHAAAMGRSQHVRIEPAALSALVGHAWPGNVRELRNVVESAALAAEGGPIDVEHLPESVRKATPARSAAPDVARASAPADATAMRDRVGELEQRSIEAALEAERGNVTRAAIRLGVSRGSLLHKLKKYGIRP